MKKSAYTIIELIFVIIIIGILAAVALPKFESTKTTTDIQKVKQELEKVKIGIQNKLNNEIISGKYSCPEIESSLNDNKNYDLILNNPIPTNDNGIKWNADKNNSDYTEYQITIDNLPTFKIKYNKDFNKSCNFTCNDNNNDNCKQIIR